MKNIKREEVVQKLKSYYNENGIVPTNFCCENLSKCPDNGEVLSRGMQCHVGSKFGEKHKVLVVSLDSGKGKDDTCELEKRTSSIEELGYFNPHMKGTLLCISDFYEIDKESKEALKYYAMTNSCKCSRPASRNKLSGNYYLNCTKHKLAEIEIINPDVIYFQGADALHNCEFDYIEGINDELKHDIRHLIFNGKKYLSVICIHPSARGRNAKKKKDFYENKIFEINKTISEILCKKLKD